MSTVIKGLFSKGTLTANGVLLDGNWIEVKEETPSGPKRRVALINASDKTGEANLALFLAAPKIYEMLQTVLGRLESMLDSTELQISDDVATEIRDIGSTAWELLNEDGNLLGIAY